jgi:hypothetical protein
MPSTQLQPSAHRWTAAELRRLQALERDAVLEAEAIPAEEYYRDNPEATAFEAFGKEVMQ